MRIKKCKIFCFTCTRTHIYINLLFCKLLNEMFFRTFSDLNILILLPPGCVAPNEWSICSNVGGTSGEQNTFPLKIKQQNNFTPVYKQF